MYIYSIAGCVTGQSHNSKSYHSQGAIMGVQSMYIENIGIPLSEFLFVLYIPQ